MREVIWTVRAEADLLREFCSLDEHSEGAGRKLLDIAQFSPITGGYRSSSPYDIGTFSLEKTR